MDQSLLSSRAIMGMYFARSEADIGLGWLDLVANLFDSDQESETYNWLGMTPRMRKWLGERKAKGFRGNGVTIINEHYEDTVEFALKDLRRDKTNQIDIRMQEMADEPRIHWAALLSELIANGASTECYDGSYFFATDHSEGDSGTQSNKINIDISGLPAEVHGTTTNPSVAEMQLAMLQMIGQIKSFKDDQGKKMNRGARSFLALVPDGLYIPAQQAVSAMVSRNMAPDTNPNALAGLDIKVESDADSAWTDTFAMFRTDAPTKALIRQQETEPMLKAKAEGSEFEFDNDAWQFGVDVWRGVGYGHWQRACQGTLT